MVVIWEINKHKYYYDLLIIKNRLTIKRNFNTGN